jgi:demethylmenaquinone methyltransferase / 2-methoxy-6-polyprenyl-1,4-benzoquinol methylase
MDNNLSKDKKIIAPMFDSIAPKYDALNHILSFNIDKKWRKRLIAIIKQTEGKKVLDLACGTGEVSRGLAKNGIEVVGLDLSSEMIKIARNKTNKSLDIKYSLGEADSIPFPDGTFDAVTIAFGIRNFDNREKCIEEIFRVIKPNGMLAILEFTTPQKIIFKSIYSFYFKWILPNIGGLISKNKNAYKYLHQSAVSFPQRECFCKELEMGGFNDVKFEEQTMGIASIYIANKY